MTDYRNFRPGHDLRSQLGLLPLESQFANRMGELVRASNPATAKPSPLAQSINIQINNQETDSSELAAKIAEQIRSTMVNGGIARSQALFDARRMGGPVNRTEPGKPIPVGVSKGYRLQFAGVDVQDGATAAMLSRASSIVGVDQDKILEARKKFAEAFSLLTDALQDQ